MKKLVFATIIIITGYILLGALNHVRAEPISTPIQRVVVKDDPGGRLDQYLQSLVLIKKAGLGVKFDGMCASACTLIVNTELSLDVCITQNAKLGIHHPFLMSSDGDIAYSIPAIAQANQVWSEVFYKKYPEWLRKFIDTNNGAPDVYLGAAPSDLLEVPFSELSKHMATCQ